MRGARGSSGEEEVGAGEEVTIGWTELPLVGRKGHACKIVDRIAVADEQRRSQGGGGRAVDWKAYVEELRGGKPGVARRGPSSLILGEVRLGALSWRDTVLWRFALLTIWKLGPVE